MARLERTIGTPIGGGFWKAADSLQAFHIETILRSVFRNEKYRKMVFGKWYLLIYQIKGGEQFFVEY